MNNQYDDILKDGLLLYLELDNANIPPEDEIDYVFSEKFNKFQAKMIKKVSRPYYSLINTAAKRAAVIIICLILACSSLLTVKAVREKVVDFFYKIYSTYTQIISEDSTSSNNDTLETVYTIPFIPNDFEFKYKDTNDFRNYYLWENIKAQKISFEQAILNSPPILNTEDANIIEKTINNTACLFIQQNTDYLYYWEFNNYRFLLIYPIDLGEEYAETVIGKLVEVTE